MHHLVDDSPAEHSQWRGSLGLILLSKALDVPARALEGENPVPVAVHIFKACGLYGLLAPHGLVEPEAAVAEQERVNKRNWRVRMADMLSIVLPGVPGQGSDVLASEDALRRAYASNHG